MVNDLKYPSICLGQAAEIIMGQSPPGSTYNETGAGLPFYQGIADFGQRYPSRRVFCTAPTRVAEKGDILISVRAPIGRVNLAIEKCAIGRGLAIVRIQQSLDKTYIEFFLRSISHIWDTLESQGSVFGNAKREDLEKLEIAWPPSNIRHAIADILGTLDDKIELNRRMNETLETMAQAIFKSWFVNFDPVIDNALCVGNAIPSALAERAARRREMLARAKSEGRESCFPKRIAALFPDRFVNSELGPIPDGWKVYVLGDLLELAYGKALKEENRRPGRVCVYGSNGQVGWHDEVLASGPGIIVGRKGNPGTITWAPSDFFAIDTTFFVVLKDKCRSLPFLFYALSLHDLRSLAADSAVPGLNRNFVYSDAQLMPPVPVLEVFDRITETFFDKQFQNDEESRILTELRDLLLPKLISGELEIKKAKKISEENYGRNRKK
jgi:type I restriction enzyme S subunit